MFVVRLVVRAKQLQMIAYGRNGRPTVCFSVVLWAGEDLALVHAPTQLVARPVFVFAAAVLFDSERPTARAAHEGRADALMGMQHNCR